uniref:Uncharacterized protein n=1 Tax=Romanomermis culicivorax TaxID=13658 RepID=A0A915IP65_ROMCU
MGFSPMKRVNNLAKALAVQMPLAPPISNLYNSGSLKAVSPWREGRNDSALFVYNNASIATSYATYDLAGNVGFLTFKIFLNVSPNRQITDDGTEAHMSRLCPIAKVKKTTPQFYGRACSSTPG